jgi:hypothetical protein
MNRRAFLQAGGACLALPFLESRARAEDGPVYTVIVRQANGVTQGDTVGEEDRYWPYEPGALNIETLAGATERVLSELAPWADRMIAIKGLDFPFAGDFCGHSGGGNQLLTGAQVSDRPSVNFSLAMGESVDNRIARAFDNFGGEPLTLYTGPRRNFLEEVLSYRGAKDRRAAEDDPWNAYKRMIGPLDLDELVLERQLSVNDLLLDQIHGLLASPKLSQGDVRRLQLHFDSVREFELLACRMSEDEEQAMARLSGEGTLDANRITIAKMHMDLIALSFACDHSRAATLQIGDGNDGTRYTIDGELLPSFHWLSHRIATDGDAGDIIDGAEDKHHAIDRLMAQTFTHLLERLDENGVLEQSVAILTSDLGNGVSHSYADVPFILVGEGGGQLKTGQFLDYGGISHHLLLTTLCQIAGVTDDAGDPLSHFGDTSLQAGILDEILA